ncbi:MAG TPA: 5-oxoprolinase subunit PxpA [Gemmatimonadaceae bacterium]
MRVDLNADLGEGFGTTRRAEDAALLDLVSSANIACGFHAGDATTMSDTVHAAHERGVAIGAHPSYPDIPGFGRRELGLDVQEIFRHVSAQLRALTEVCTKIGARVSYVKPHGALYNRAVTDRAAASAIIAAISDTDRSMALLGLPNSAMEAAATDSGIRFAREAFVDRAYRSDGSLVPRAQSGAVLHDSAFAVDRALRLVTDGVIETIDGNELRIRAQSLCVHGDNPDARSMLAALRERLESAGVSIAAFAS